MIIIMSRSAQDEQMERIQQRLRELGFGIHLSQGVKKTIIGAIGDKTPEIIHSIAAMEGVETLFRSRPFAVQSGF